MRRYIITHRAEGRHSAYAPSLILWACTREEALARVAVATGLSPTKLRVLRIIKERFDKPGTQFRPSRTVSTRDRASHARAGSGRREPRSCKGGAA